MIITRAPNRISLFGGGCDVEQYYSQYGALLVSCAINCYSYFFIRYTPEILSYHTRISYSKLEEVNSNSQIEHKTVKAILDFLKINTGVEITHFSDLPARTGVGSSSTFCVALLHALHLLLKNNPTSRQLAEEAIIVERKILEETGGLQDQIIAAHGGTSVIEIDRSGHYKVKPLSISDEFTQELKNSIVMLYTGKQRNSFEIAKTYHNPDKDNYKKKIHQISHEAIYAFEKEDITRIGKLLHKSWLAKTSISNLICPPDIYNLYQKGMDLGAYGGKLLGNGGSGFLIFMLDSANKLNFIEQMGLYSVNFDFDKEGAKGIL